jgi:hypothetical protein
MTQAEITRQTMESSGIGELLLYLGYMTTVIFFVYNIDKFNMMDIIIGSMASFIILKSINIMSTGLVIDFMNIKIIDQDTKLHNSIDKAEAALQELIVRETTRSANNA